LTETTYLTLQPTDRWLEIS